MSGAIWGMYIMYRYFKISLPLNFNFMYISVIHVFPTELRIPRPEPSFKTLYKCACDLKLILSRIPDQIYDRKQFLETIKWVFMWIYLVWTSSLQQGTQYNFQLFILYTLGNLLVAREGRDSSRGRILPWVNCTDPVVKLSEQCR